ncbi:chorismate mutase [Blastococcus sp. CCUG 61487]|uniref:chorismate mutase n=1 Tax=Blastococcus sp. CCUG 61487 TaxID=1840703 RepID=UPI0010C1501B|nr:chorismate mutase [Blastococcus sp. CCUG 61487]TKJ34889.1 hypothetical protein A6V29_14765 [Blastococcus sp. CCUG 61487]
MRDASVPPILTAAGEPIPLHVGRCQLVAGELDYVTDPSLIRQQFHLSVDDRVRLFHECFARASEQGAAMVSLFARSADEREEDLLPRLVEVANDYPHVGLLLNFFDERALSAALARYRGKPLVNYVSGERRKLEQVLKAVGDHPCALVLQPIGDEGMPDSVAGRMKVIEGVLRTIEGAGLSSTDIVVDALSPSHHVLPSSLRVSLGTLAEASRLGLRTIIWPENAGLGHPEGGSVVAAYIALAVHAGLDLAVLNSNNHRACAALSAANAIAAPAGGVAASPRGTVSGTTQRDEVAQLRTRMDAVDREFLAVLGKRAAVSAAIGRAKAKLGLPLFDPEREEALIDQRTEGARGLGFDPAWTADLFRHVLAGCRAAAARQLVSETAGTNRPSKHNYG